MEINLFQGSGNRSEENVNKILNSQSLLDNLLKVERIFSWGMFHDELVKIYGPQDQLDTCEQGTTAADGVSTAEGTKTAVEIIEQTLRVKFISLGKISAKTNYEYCNEILFKPPTFGF